MIGKKEIRVLGVDPGSLKCGFGVIDSKGFNINYVTSGFIDLRSYKNLGTRLNQLSICLDEIIKDTKPEFLSLEKIFVANNVKTAMNLGYARGIALALAGKYSLELNEFSATRIKKLITGKGAATKDQVNFSVKNILKINDVLQEDAADALASALSCAYSFCGTV